MVSQKSFLNKKEEGIYEIEKRYKQGMNVPALILGTDKIIETMEDAVYDQITNVACLPGIIKYAICMPDGHWGYGFPIGGVAAFDVNNGIISPGGIGFDINCGMRLITTYLTYDDIKDKIVALTDAIFTAVPAGVGSQSLISLDANELRKVMVEGSKWCISKGYGRPEDIENTEDQGCIPGARPEVVSDKAIKRGRGQVGSLGSGNHYLEIQVVKEVQDELLAQKLGIYKNQICVMVHTGSRGFGHQVADDYVKSFGKAMAKYKISVRDRQLACTPIHSKEGQNYYAAMACAANVAFANRQIITHQIRKAFCEVLGKKEEDLGLNLLYDVAHNIAKFEKYTFDLPNTGGGRTGTIVKEVLVHRKGATRSLGPGNPLLSSKFREIGQPVILGGSMETGSYLLIGTKRAEEITFGSTAHGSGRIMSRHAAMKKVKGAELKKQMVQKGIYIRSGSMRGLAEEAGFAYKDIHEVVKSLDIIGISKPIAYLSPIGNIKG